MFSISLLEVDLVECTMVGEVRDPHGLLVAMLRRGLAVRDGAPGLRGEQLLPDPADGRSRKIPGKVRLPSCVRR
jgi:hypothetical protein